MPRYSTIEGVVEEFGRKLSETVERFVERRIATALNGRRERRRVRKKLAIRCYVPGCKNIAAPRFGMFCAAEHKNLPKAKKAKYRALHDRAKQKAS